MRKFYYIKEFRVNEHNTSIDTHFLQVKPLVKYSKSFSDSCLLKVQYSDEFHTPHDCWPNVCTHPECLRFSIKTRLSYYYVAANLSFYFYFSILIIHNISILIQFFSILDYFVFLFILNFCIFLFYF